MRPVLAFALAALLGSFACKRSAPPPPAPAGRTVTDGLGRAVRLPERPARIVSLAPSSTEILFAVGAGDRVVGVDRYSDFPPEAKQRAQLGADVDPNLERIVALRPDVVFTATSANTQKTAETLERMGVPVYVSRAETLEAIQADVLGIGGAVGQRAEAEKLVAGLRARVAALAARTAGRPPVKAVVVVAVEPLIVAGRTSHIGDLVRAAGGTNVADDSPQPFPTYSLERLVARAPDVMIIGTYPDDPAPKLGVLERLDLPAVKSRRVHTVVGDLVFRPGPRVVDGIEALARLFHPGADVPVPPDPAKPGGPPPTARYSRDAAADMKP